MSGCFACLGWRRGQSPLVKCPILSGRRPHQRNLPLLGQPTAGSLDAKDSSQALGTPAQSATSPGQRPTAATSAPTATRGSTTGDGDAASTVSGGTGSTTKSGQSAVDVSNLPSDVEDALTTVARYNPTQPSKELAESAVPVLLPGAIFGFVRDYICTVARAKQLLSSANSEEEEDDWWCSGEDQAISGETAFVSSESATTTGSTTTPSTTTSGGASATSGQSAVDVSNLPSDVKDALKAVTDYAISAYNDEHGGSFTATDSMLEKLHANMLVFCWGGGERGAAPAARGGTPTGTTPSTTVGCASVTPAQSATLEQRSAA